MTLDEDIVAWHKKTFPDITMGELLLKLEEELTETFDAINAKAENAMEEQADVYIVAVALMERFNSKIGLHFYTISHTDKLLMKAVRHKLDKNKKRIWHKVDGVYRHKEEE